MINLDGSLGEGGGQILRSALALSLITQQPFTISNIRAKRPKPGLMRQHLACVAAAGAICGIPLEAITGAALGSVQLTFVPRPVCAGDYAFNVGSAGSCMLVLQTIVWPLLLASAPSKLKLQGGTHNPMAPSSSYLQHTLPQVLAQTGGNVQIQTLRHGFYPAGGGVVDVAITPPVHKSGQPARLMPMSFCERGALQSASVQCLHAGIPKRVAERELQTVGQLMGWQDAQLQNTALRQNEGPGNALEMVLTYAHIKDVFTAFGERGKSAEQVAKDVVTQARTYQSSTAPVGEYLADQLMLPMALAATAAKTVKGAVGAGAGVGAGADAELFGGEYIATEISEHARTNAAVIEAFLPVRFVFKELGEHTGARVSLLF